MKFHSGQNCANFKIPQHDQTRLRYGVFAAVLRRLPRGLARSRRRLIAVAACSYLDVKSQTRFLTVAMAANGSPQVRYEIWRAIFGPL